MLIARPSSDLRVQGSWASRSAVALFFLGSVLEVGACIGGTTGREDLRLAATDAGDEADTSEDVMPDAMDDAGDADEMDAVDERKHRRALDASLAGDVANLGDVSLVGDAAQEAAPTPVCGNLIVESGEDCDDGNQDDTDGCSSHCTYTYTKDCSDCLSEMCSDFLPDCQGLDGVAKAGPAMGSPKVDLCHELDDCIVRSNCAFQDLRGASYCYCGTAQGSCWAQPKAANGPCKSQVEAAAESTAPQTIQGNFGNLQLAVGSATQLAQCGSDNSCSACARRSPDAGAPDSGM